MSNRGIPSAVGIDPAVQRILEPMIETMELREGMRQRTLGMNVTFQDLIDLGLITESQANDHIA
jgi:hypothetical protein